MRKLYVPCALTLHTCANWAYFYDPGKTHMYSGAWGTYFHCVQAFALFTFCMIFAYTGRKSFFDKQFILIEAFYNLTLFFAYELNYKRILINNHSLMITGIAIALSTLLLMYSGIKHGYFKDIYNG